MADNFGGNENIYFTDDQNIVLVDPNSIFDSNGQKKDRNIKQENLVMYANLEAQAVPRTRLAVGQGVESGVNNVAIAEINFLKPKDKDYFDTSYTEQLTGGRNSQGGGLNQIQFDGAQNPQQINFVDTQLLGIRAISVDIKYNGIPEVNMVLVDIQGKSLFETGGNSPYSVFLYYPYPMFKLTLKGYYGKAIQYELMLLNFNANFDAGTGNFIVDLKFIARTSAILDDIRLGYLFALPNMYPNNTVQQVGENVTSENATASVQQNNAGVTQESIINTSSKGYSKLKEVFDLYKSNNLIDENVPVLTLNEMSINLKRYTEFLNKQFEELDFSKIVALNRYQESLKKFNSEITKWKGIYINNRDVLVLNNGIILYGLNNVEIVTDDGNGVNNSSSNRDRKNNADASLTGITGTYTKELKSLSKLTGPIEFSGDPSNIQTFTEKFTIDDINFPETFFKQEGVRVTSPLTDERFISFKNSLTTTLQLKGSLITVENSETTQSQNNFYYYTFGRFDGDIKNVNGVVLQRAQLENENLNRVLLDNVKKNGNVRNLTFRPTVRNVTGVIMASVDAFYRLMNDVHKNSWEQRQNPYRIKSILRNVPSQEGVNLVESTNSNLTKSVYPWPQFVQKSETNEKTEYEVTYPGAKSVSNFTKGYDPRIWPEVEFVEEYLKAAVTTGEAYDSDIQSNSRITLNYTTSSAIEIEYQNDVYSDTNVVEFMYEFYERLYMNAFYSGLYYTNVNEDLTYVGSQIELNNIVSKNLPYGPLRDVLVNVLPTTTVYDYLKTTSGPNNEGEKWNNFIQQRFNTPYIANRTTDTFKVYSTSQYNKISKKPIKLESQDRIERFLKSTNSSVLTPFDTYPFVSQEFKNKMEFSPTRNTPHQTIQTLNFDSSNLVITNYGSVNVAPITKNKSSVTGYTESQISNTTINNFYNLRFDDGTKRMITEGNISYDSSSSLNARQTISMLNTPYFTNSVIEASTITGDDKFIKPAYLFLNSLPLSTLYERYFNLSSGEKSDYIFASLNKFSGVHKLPFAWILKIGSVYHRYKKYIETDVDILDSIWKDFDYKKAYDPTNSNVNRVYSVKLNADEQRSQFSLDSVNYLNLGFYPQVYNSFYKFFTGYDLFPNGDVNSVTDTYYKYFKIVSTRPATTVNGPINSYYSYITVEDDLTPFFGSENLNKKLLLPSSGFIPFQQTYYELTSSNSKTFLKTEIINQQPMYNGSVKFYWSAPTYGWFDNGKVRKPNYDEYLKTVRPESGDSQTEFDLASQYSKIEDLFGVFTKQQLDFFETEFLEFCKENGTSSIFLSGDGVDSTYSSFINIFKKMFLINEKTPGIVDSQTLGNSQSVQISEVLDKFINVNVYTKIGNPKKFDRQFFGYFSNNNLFKPSVFNYDLGVYATGSLPDGTTTLEVSQSANPEAWNALYTNIGFSTIPRLTYTDQGSYITDFFIDNNVAFNVNNIVNLAPLIKIYATQKLSNPNSNSTTFSTTISDLMSGAENKRLSIEKQIIRGKLALDLSNQNPDDSEEKVSTINGDTIKLDTWELFKAVNDKWVSGIDFSEKLLFDEFLFFDRANRDIGDELILNVDTINKYCSWNNANVSVMSILRQLMANNKMNFLVMPAYINFYGKPSRRSTNRNQTILNNANDIFSTFTYVDYIDSAPKFLCQYVDRPSQTLSMENDPNYPFKDDSFDLGNPTNNPIRSTSTSVDEYKNNKAVGFVVDFGVQNQSVFKSINITQNQNVTSSEQIQVLIDMGKQGSGKQTTQQTTALFEFYKNRSYDCEVSIIGNVMIQPTMYFVLRHIPMFNGTYMIRNVKHTISAGQFNTTFQGQRISSMINSKIRNELGAINEDFTKKLNNKIKTFVTNNTLVTYDSNLKQYLIEDDGKTFQITNRIPYQGNIPLSKDDTVQACLENVNQTLSKIVNINYVEQEIPLKSVSTLLKSQITDVNQRLYMFTMLYMMGYSVSNGRVGYKLNNLYGVTADIDWGQLSGSIKGYRCLKTVENIIIPFAYFDKIEDSISFVNSYYSEKIKPYFNSANPNTTNTLCNNNVNYTDIAYLDCTTELFIKIFYETWWTSGNSRDGYESSSLYNEWIVRAKEGIVKGLQPDFGLI
jgi:hypothetical protein